MSPLTQFSAPAFLTDFTPKNAKRWSTEYVSPQITAQAERQEISQFYNELMSSWTETPTPASITWVAFPNNIAISEGSDRARWRRADLRGVQDEYCEWTVQRNEKNEIVRVVFTAEGPEVCLEFILSCLGICGGLIDKITSSTGIAWRKCSRTLSSSCTESTTPASTSRRKIFSQTARTLDTTNGTTRRSRAASCT